jgi:hypothetical protein
MTHHFLFLIGVIRVDQWSDFGVCLRFSISAIFGNHGNFGNLVDTHPAFFSAFVENKGRTVNRPLGGPCVTLGVALAWPLGGPRVAQSQTPIPNQAEGHYRLHVLAEC